jgi:NAD kinase
MSGNAPRVVIVTRPTELEELLARHATHGQARFFLETRGQSIEPVEERHQSFEVALHGVLQAVPRSWRRCRIQRADLDRFLFEPEDIVVVLGQDGLVANTSKYLTGQRVIGLNPDPELYDGILVQHPPEAAADLLDSTHRGLISLEQRTMVCAELDDGQRLLALNEVFVGQQSHQSARYRISHHGSSEEHSSSGVICATGTGSTGWAHSINRVRSHPLVLPEPEDRALAFFVREAFPSVATGTDVVQGTVANQERLEVVSRMNSGGVIFGDGIESDRIEFNWGRRVHIGVSDNQLNLVN